jgi:hypothetical protein
MFLGLLDPDPDPLGKVTDPDPLGKGTDPESGSFFLPKFITAVILK